LSGSVPYLKLDNFIINSNVLEAKLDSDGKIVIDVKLTVNETADQTGFADSGVADQNEFKSVVVIVRALHLSKDIFIYNSITITKNKLDLYYSAKINWN
jgi:hypothetical protein